MSVDTQTAPSSPDIIAPEDLDKSATAAALRAEFEGVAEKDEGNLNSLMLDWEARGVVGREQGNNAKKDDVFGGNRLVANSHNAELNKLVIDVRHATAQASADKLGDQIQEKLTEPAVEDSKIQGKVLAQMVADRFVSGEISLVLSNEKVRGRGNNQVKYRDVEPQPNQTNELLRAKTDLIQKEIDALVRLPGNQRAQFQTEINRMWPGLQTAKTDQSRRRIENERQATAAAREKERVDAEFKVESERLQASQTELAKAHAFMMTEHTTAYDQQMLKGDTLPPDQKQAWQAEMDAIALEMYAKHQEKTEADAAEAQAQLKQQARDIINPPGPDSDVARLNAARDYVMNQQPDLFNEQYARWNALATTAEKDAWLKQMDQTALKLLSASEDKATADEARRDAEMNQHAKDVLDGTYAHKMAGRVADSDQAFDQAYAEALDRWHTEKRAEQERVLGTSQAAIDEAYDRAYWENKDRKYDEDYKRFDLDSRNRIYAANPADRGDLVRASRYEAMQRNPAFKQFETDKFHEIAMQEDASAREQQQLRAELQRAIDALPNTTSALVRTEMEKARDEAVKDLVTKQNAKAKREAMVARESIIQAFDINQKAAAHESSRDTITMDDKDIALKTHFLGQAMDLPQSPVDDRSIGGLLHWRKDKRGPKLATKIYMEPGEYNKFMVVTNSRQKGKRASELVSTTVITTEKPAYYRPNRLRRSGSKLVLPAEMKDMLQDIHQHDRNLIRTHLKK